MSDKIESVLFSYQKNVSNRQYEDKTIIRKTEYVNVACDRCRKSHSKCSGEPKCAKCMKQNLSCVFNKFPNKRGPKRKKRKLPFGNTDLESSNPMHSKVIIQRNIIMEILIQALETMEVLIKELDDRKYVLMIKFANLFNMLVEAGLYNLESPPSTENEEGAALPLYAVMDNFINKINGIITKL
ncbi:24356_t:CDS:1 [Racocetra persica]|uniref:24356_t:CDS:1 n=1 Tax=Racocetra persica TaxID=160502 RepID=A0ACA9P4Q0_9GLOM|nr:24356_t:CDS:1 [Racocetra persica]